MKGIMDLLLIGISEAKALKLVVTDQAPKSC